MFVCLVYLRVYMLVHLDHSIIFYSNEILGEKIDLRRNFKRNIFYQPRVSLFSFFLRSFLLSFSLLSFEINTHTHTQTTSSKNIDLDTLDGHHALRAY